jgi:hypothetical protein
VRARPKCAARGARQGIAAVPVRRELHLEPGEVDLGAGVGFLVMGGGDHAQVVDPGRVRRRRRRWLDGFVHVRADHEQDGGPGRPPVQEHLDPGQVFWLVTQLDAPVSAGSTE